MKQDAYVQKSGFCVHVEKDNEYITSCGERFAFKCKYCPRCGKKVVNK